MNFMTLALALTAAPNLPPAELVTPSSFESGPAYQTLSGDPTAGALAAPVARRAFESDKAFEGFVNPVTNPILAKDPRSSTWARILILNNNLPGSHPLGGGNVQAYGMQVNIALTERLTFIADKDGYADVNIRNVPHTGGWLNVAAGLKYTFIRDVENQFLAAAGVMYEIPSGESDAFQGHGSGQITPFLTWGKQVCDNWHILATHGYTAAVNQTTDSSFFYHSLHVDRAINGWFYPLVEVNWFQYTQGGNRLPRPVGEADGLINLGTQGMAGRQLLSTAVGAKMRFSEHLYAGVAYEFALTGYKGLLNNRITADLVVRY